MASATLAPTPEAVRRRLKSSRLVSLQESVEGYRVLPVHLEGSELHPLPFSGRRSPTVTGTSTSYTTPPEVSTSMVASSRESRMPRRRLITWFSEFEVQRRGHSTNDGASTFWVLFGGKIGWKTPECGSISPQATESDYWKRSNGKEPQPPRPPRRQASEAPSTAGAAGPYTRPGLWWRSRFPPPLS